MKTRSAGLSTGLLAGRFLVDVSTVQTLHFPAAKHSMRRDHQTSTNRTRNPRAFQPTIPLRILSQILLVIILRIGNLWENRGVNPYWDVHLVGATKCTR